MSNSNSKKKTYEVDEKSEKKFELKINSQFHFVMTLKEREMRKV